MAAMSKGKLSSFFLAMQQPERHLSLSLSLFNLMAFGLSIHWAGLLA